MANEFLSQFLMDSIPIWNEESNDAIAWDGMQQILYESLVSERERKTQETQLGRRRERNIILIFMTWFSNNVIHYVFSEFQLFVAIDFIPKLCQRRFFFKVCEAQ